jgi:hypothetical protein
MDDRPIVTAILSAEGGIEGWLTKSTPQLVVRCQTPADNAHKFPTFIPAQPGLEMYLVIGMPAHVENGEGLHTLRVRFDDQPAESLGA